MADSLLKRILQHGIQSQALHVVDTPDWTGSELVPTLLRSKSPATFQNKGLEFGLRHRTLTKSPAEVFKFDIARILHSTLAPSNSSWDRFARDVVGDVNRARRAYSESSARFSDEEVYYILALDALFTVVLFKYANGRSFFLKEFEALAGRLSEVLTTIMKTDFFLIENQVPVYLLQSAIRQLSVSSTKKLWPEDFVDAEFQIEFKVEEELEMVLYEAVLRPDPSTHPEKSNGSFRS